MVFDCLPLALPPASQEDLARYQRDQAEGVYAGGHEELPPFNQTVPDDKVGLQTFKYVASLVSEGWAAHGCGLGRQLLARMRSRMTTPL